jgi:hypothetical protein
MKSTVNVTVPTTAQLRRYHPWLLWTGGILGGLILIALLAVGLMIYRMNYVPPDLDTSTTLLTEQRLYRIGYVPEFDPVPINQIQRWLLHIETADGQPVENAQIRVDGDMPQHGHGLPTRPQVTRHLGNGDYQVEGLKFHMPGWWVVDFDIDASGQSDRVRFNLLLR